MPGATTVTSSTKAEVLEVVDSLPDLLIGTDDGAAFET